MKWGIVAIRALLSSITCFLSQRNPLAPAAKPQAKRRTRSKK